MAKSQWTGLRIFSIALIAAVVAACKPSNPLTPAPTDNPAPTPKPTSAAPETQSSGLTSDSSQPTTR